MFIIPSRLTLISPFFFLLYLHGKVISTIFPFLLVKRIVIFSKIDYNVGRGCVRYEGDLDMNRKRISAMVIAAFMLFLYACGSASENGIERGTEGQEFSFTPCLDTDVEITLYAIGRWENFEALEEVARGFNEFYPNVTIGYTLPDDYVTTLKNRMITGEELDFYVLQNPDWYDSDIYTRDAADLEEADIDFSNMPPQVKQEGYIDGKMKLFPIMQSVNGYMVNTTLLEEQGLSIPTNYHEFMAVCKRLKEKGITPVMGYPDSVYIPSANGFFMDVALADNREEIVEGLNRGEDNFGIVKQNLQAALELKEKGYISQEGEDLEDGYNAVIMRFLEGDVPFMACSAEGFSGVKKREDKSQSFENSPFSYQFIPSPTGETGFEACFTQEVVFCAYEKSPNIDYTMEFFRFLSTKKELDIIGTVKGMPTVTEHSGDERFDVLENLSEPEKIYFSDVGINFRVAAAYRGACKALGNEETDLEGAVEVFRQLMEN